jgi:hypothetical protein
MISKGENELLCRTGPGTPMGRMVSFWVSQHTYEPEAPSVIAAKSGPWVRTDFLACSTLSPRWNCSSRPDLLDSPFPCDICACVTSLPPSLRRLPVRCEAKPEERESFLGGGNEQKSLGPAARAMYRQGALAFFVSWLTAEARRAQRTRQ